MATLKEFEEVLRAQGMRLALEILERLRERDRATRTIRPARRVVGRKMTPELAQAILDMHASTEMTQQEIAFKLGVNQGRVNEVIKRGKWLSGDPNAPEAQSRDRALAKMERQRETRRPRTRTQTTSRRAAGDTAERAGSARRASPEAKASKVKASKAPSKPTQLLLGDL